MKRLFAIAVLMTAAAAPAIADAGPMAHAAGARGRVQLAQGPSRPIPLSRVLAMIASRVPGRHLNTNMGDAGGRPAYFVQWQREDGRVVVFVVDAETGQVLREQGR
jgi:uncharacterized membrane protein YkoI